MAKIHSKIDDFKAKKGSVLSHYRRCHGYEYILQKIEDADCLICASCGNDTWEDVFEVGQPQL